MITKINEFADNMKDSNPSIDKETGMYMYPKNTENISDNFWSKIKIIVNSEGSKQQVLKALEYIHNLECIDSDFMPVNSLMHLYLYPDSVEVKPDYNFDYGKPRDKQR